MCPRRGQWNYESTSDLRRRYASDADMLRHLLDAKGISQVELHRQTGIPKSTISEVLAGKKPFSRTMIRTLANCFQVDTSVLAANL
jgi:HTH-type transcriptional regulator / antitoxin HigA